MKLEELRINIENRIAALGYDVADSTVPVLTGINDTVRVYVDIAAGERQVVQQCLGEEPIVACSVTIHISVIGTGQKRFDDVPNVAEAILGDLAVRANYAQIGLHQLQASKWNMGIGEGTPIQRIHVTEYLGVYTTTSTNF